MSKNFQHQNLWDLMMNHRESLTVIHFTKNIYCKLSTSDIYSGISRFKFFKKKKLCCYSNASKIIVLSLFEFPSVLFMQHQSTLEKKESKLIINDFHKGIINYRLEISILVDASVSWIVLRLYSYKYRITFYEFNADLSARYCIIYKF